MESWARDRGAGWSPRSISSPQYADRPSPLFGRQANVIGHGGQRQRSFQLKSPRHSLNKDMREECRVGVSPYASGDRQRRRESTKEKDSMLKDKKATIPTELDRDIKGDSTDPSLEEGECYFENLEKKLNPHESGSVEPARRKDEPLPLDSREDKEALLRARLKATLEELARIEKEKADGQREDGNVAVDDAFDTYKNKNEETGKLGATRFESSQDVKMGVNRIKQPSGGEAVCFRKEVRNDGHTPPTGIQQGNGFAGTDLDNSSKRENSSKVSDESTSLQYASFCEKKGKDDGTMEEDPTIDASWPLGSA
ncbi:hypothetical protein IE53DRAFT_359843 [Violaceomyces palustris]|uniref:Uncharacterized protein n=1 Tax=Violaceomyces palustris TaxID=1673888 RepID=A0ACD0P6Q9_9BASI|nr:hypothetical protein IE53DRAFT_359843 [Violaceomyces palustris]